MSDQTDDSTAGCPPIVRMGDPVLRQVAAEVADPTAPEIQDLIAEMTVSLAEAGGIGLAAPQIGIGRRVILFKVPDARATDDPDDGPCPLTALVNPSFAPLDDEMALGWEGCLSIPGLRGEVPRHQRIKVRGTTPEGSVFEAVLAGTRARVVQHEVDHLDGVLYLDRMTDLVRLGFTEEIMEAEAARKWLGADAGTGEQDG
ncbi:MAG: peptide deformylase [Alphaproteobacteria bacterium]|nr:peptide deformylase [Alphaproteobacteria bacterium]